ncbi:MAG: hypothetical protein HKM23_00585 [Nitrosopumilus sp.]|nr:hypothetical protein [Nitrosopumilus sp.]NNL59576.1 hypothetical protein [Nitrosopumilus sp.]
MKRDFAIMKNASVTVTRDQVLGEGTVGGNIARKTIQWSQCGLNDFFGIS